MTNTDIVDTHDLTFDPGDPSNGSLYVCRVRNSTSDNVLDQIIADLRANEIWSDAEPKQVADDQRAAYKRQLQFIEAVTYRIEDEKITIARFDHEKFPSDQGRWDDWKNAFDAQYARA